MHDQHQNTAHGHRAAFTRGLHEIAEFLDQHPEVPLPYMGSYISGDLMPTLAIYLNSTEDQRATLAGIARAMGTAEKIADDKLERLSVVRRFSGVALVAVADRREVCERVVIGTETVQVEEDACPKCSNALTIDGDGAMVCSDDSSHYRAAQPGKRVATTEREIVKWECTSLLADRDEAKPVPA